MSAAFAPFVSACFAVVVASTVIYFCWLGEILKTLQRWFFWHKQNSKPWIHKRPARFHPWSPAAGIMNLRSVIVENRFGWLDVDQDYLNAMELKHILLTCQQQVVMGTAEKVEQNSDLEHLLQQARVEVFECILDELESRFAGLVVVKRGGSANSNPDSTSNFVEIHNLATGRSFQEPKNSELLRIAAEMVQEDLILLLPAKASGVDRACIARRVSSTKQNPDNDDNVNDIPFFFLAEGVLCFADRWLLSDKLGKSVHHIHAPVDHYSDPISTAVDLFLEKLQPGVGVRIRYNYTFQRGGHLHFNLEQRELSEEEEESQEGIVYLRVERQGLRKLQCGAVLFTIRTYLSPVDEIPEGKVRTDLQSVFDGKVGTSLGKAHLEHSRRMVTEAW